MTLPLFNVGNHLLQACYAFMVPVARFLLRSGVSYKEFAEIARLAFVTVASEDYGIRSRPTNISRVAALTGIPRKEVRRLREFKAQYEEDWREHLRTSVSPLAEVLHRWFTDRKYLDESGKPLPLAFSGPFTQLVRACARDLPAGAIKVELIRCGAVVEDARGRLRPVRRVLVPANLDEILASRMAIALRGLASTIAYNCNPYDPKTDDQGRIERVVHTNRIPARATKKLRLVLRKRIAVFCEEIDDLLSKSEVERTGEEAGGTVGVGVYYYEDP